MEITEVRIRLLESRRDRLRAYATITFNNTFVVRDLRVIEGGRGIFVAMPSRRLADRCPRCACKNHLRAVYCNDCGARLPTGRVQKDITGRPRLHCDVCHPVNKDARQQLEDVILNRFREENSRKKQGLYQPPPEDEYEVEDDGHFEMIYE